MPHGSIARAARRCCKSDQHLPLTSPKTSTNPPTQHHFPSQHYRHAPWVRHRRVAWRVARVPPLVSPSSDHKRRRFRLTGTRSHMEESGGWQRRSPRSGTPTRRLPPGARTEQGGGRRTVCLQHRGLRGDERKEVMLSPGGDVVGVCNGTALCTAQRARLLGKAYTLCACTAVSPITEKRDKFVSYSVSRYSVTGCSRGR